jgi:hypothetical protein
VLLSEEWSRNNVVDNMNLELSTYAPAIMEFNNLIAEVVGRNGPHATAEEVIPLVRASGHFVDDHYVLFPVCSFS